MKVMKRIIFFLVVFWIAVSLPYSIFSEVIEKWSKEKVHVGETVTYELEFSPNDVKEWKLPEKGFLYKNKEDEESKLPYCEITSIQKTDRSIQITVKFLDKGDYSLPIRYIDSKNEEYSIAKKVKVETSVQSEKDLVDIQSPIEFNGNYIVRLLLLVLIVASVIGSVLYAIYYITRKKPIDAIVQQPLIIEPHNYYLEKMESLLKKDTIDHKEFIYTLSGYIKEKVYDLYNENLDYLTLDELSIFLLRKMHPAGEEIRKESNYFISIKYMPDDSQISVVEAFQRFNKWKEIFL